MCLAICIMLLLYIIWYCGNDIVDFLGLILVGIGSILILEIYNKNHLSISGGHDSISHLEDDAEQAGKIPSL